MRYTGALVIAFTFFVSAKFSMGQASAGYQAEIASWHQGRIESLRSESGWLNLEGLFWLEQGSNTFGSGKQNSLVFPTGSIASAAGYFELTGTTVKLVSATDAAISVNGKTVKEAIVFHPDSDRTSLMSHGTLRWTIIKRDEKIGVRLRDLNSLQLRQFKDIDRFPVDSAWKIEGMLQENTIPKSVAITNVLGQTTQQKLAGKAVFSIKGKQYALDALEEGDELFIIFGDETSARTTYAAGRFLYAHKPGADGKIILDFNKSINPPCAFTDYATCPLPPKQNILAVEIFAGEKNYKSD